MIGAVAGIAGKLLGGAAGGALTGGLGSALGGALGGGFGGGLLGKIAGNLIGKAAEGTISDLAADLFEGGPAGKTNANQPYVEHGPNGLTLHAGENSQISIDSHPGGSLTVAVNGKEFTFSAEDAANLTIETDSSDGPPGLDDLVSVLAKGPGGLGCGIEMLLGPSGFANPVSGAGNCPVSDSQIAMLRSGSGMSAN